MEQSLLLCSKYIYSSIENRIKKNAESKVHTKSDKYSLEIFHFLNGEKNHYYLHRMMHTEKKRVVI